MGMDTMMLILNIHHERQDPVYLEQFITQLIFLIMSIHHLEVLRACFAMLDHGSLKCLNEFIASIDVQTHSKNQLCISRIVHSSLYPSNASVAVK